PLREPGEPGRGAQVPRVRARALRVGRSAGRQAALRAPTGRRDQRNRGNALRRRRTGGASRKLCSCHQGKGTRCGRRHGGTPRAQARARNRTPGARAPGALRPMNKPINMVDPAGEYASLKNEIDTAVARVFASGRFVLGPEGEALEREICQFVGAAHAVGCNSGTDALHFPLVVAGIGPGDEVIIPGFTFFATGEAVSYTGATPVFADVEEATFNLDPASLKKFITKKTKAVIAVHLFGQCANLEEISRICKEHKLLLVEDCAQCIGADFQGKRAGSWGDFGGFSFYPTKNLAAAGDAGLI